MQESAAGCAQEEEELLVLAVVVVEMRTTTRTMTAHAAACECCGVWVLGGMGWWSLVYLICVWEGAVDKYSQLSAAPRCTLCTHS